MLLLLLLVLPCSSLAPYASWMSDFSSTLANRSLFEVTLPGTHDSLTSQLSLRVADNANNVPPVVAKLLHSDLPEGEVAAFIRAQAVTQTLNMTAMLATGIRFVDFRMVYTLGPAPGSTTADWYVLHILESKAPVWEYLAQLAAFLSAHPREVVVLRITYHSGDCTGFPGATTADTATFWKRFEAMFSPLLFDHDARGLNETTFKELWSLNQRLVVYVADWANVTARSGLARDACLHLEQYDPPTGVVDEALTQQRQIKQMTEARTQRAALKAQNRLWIAYYSTSSPEGQTVARAVLDVIDPNMTAAHRASVIALCAASFKGLPGNQYCPDTLLNVTSLSNYYLSRIFNWSLARPALQLPHVVYVDNVVEHGLMTTAPDAQYAFVAYVLRKSLFGALSAAQCDQHAQCAPLAQQLRDRGVGARKDDPAIGRVPSWPPLPENE